MHLFYPLSVLLVPGLEVRKPSKVQWGSYLNPFTWPVALVCLGSFRNGKALGARIPLDGNEVGTLGRNHVGLVDTGREWIDPL